MDQFLSDFIVGRLGFLYEVFCQFFTHDVRARIVRNNWN